MKYMKKYSTREEFWAATERGEIQPPILAKIMDEGERVVGYNDYFTSPPLPEPEPA